mgnify:CR=1 FL=1
MKVSGDGGKAGQKQHHVETQHLPDADGHLRQRYGVPAHGGAYLLRPDQHICARWLTLDATRLQAALNNALPR